MLNRDFARKQVNRLAGLISFPQVPEAVGEIVSAIELAPDERSATQFVSDWLAVNVRTPKPAEIRQALRAERETRSVPLSDVQAGQCTICRGVGWEILDIGEGRTAARKCNCRIPVRQEESN
jgi:hypothetical protein